MPPRNKRLTREQSQALTRARLLAAATELFGRDGYASTSVERIAEQAGYSKGAAYSNFESKEALFLEVLELQGQESLDVLIAMIGNATGPDSLRDMLVAWADDRSRSGGWALTILEFARVAGRDSAALRRQEAVIREHWRRLGDAVLERVPALASSTDGLTLGALFHEIAYAPALTLVEQPTSGQLMRLVLDRLIAATSESNPG